MQSYEMSWLPPSRLTLEVVVFLFLALSWQSPRFALAHIITDLVGDLNQIPAKFDKCPVSFGR